jgi:hypothetical protein
MRKEVLGEKWENSQSVHEEFNWLQIWFEKRYQEKAQPVIMKGLSEQGVKRISSDFINLVSRYTLKPAVQLLTSFRQNTHRETAV